jgi:ATP adenylyltransferase
MDGMKRTSTRSAFALTRGSKQKGPVVDLRFAKTVEYRNVLETIRKDGRCPFCPQNFKYHKNPILKRSGGWLITKNSWPYQNTKHHFILLGIKHKETLDQLSLHDLKAIFALLRWAVKRFAIKGGGFAMRFGETRFTGSTVVHLHAHLIVPKLKRGQSTTVLFPFG